MNKNNNPKKILFSIVLVFFITNSIISSGNLIEKNPIFNIEKSKSIEDPKISPPDSNIVVYSAHQNLNSRIVLINNDNMVINKFDYSNKKFLDLEVVNNIVYALEALNPSVYRINIETGNTELIIDDSNLNNPYSLAFGNNYFYIVDDRLNRYDVNGNFQGSADLNETVYGASWDGVFYWILNNNNKIKCYDLSNWPNIVEGPFPTINTPSSKCRGLFFDGMNFWTAEYDNNAVGKIYKIDYLGNVIKELVEPYIIGWSACTVAVPNIPPEKPDRPSGPEMGVTGIKYTYSTSTIDPDDQGQVFYKWDWGDNTTSNWLGPYNSGEIVNESNAWGQGGLYEVRVKAKDIYNTESEWSDPLIVNISNEEHMNFIIGKISNLYTGPEYITFNANLLLWIIVDSLEIIRYRSGEQLTISHNYFGILRENFVFCVSF